VASAWRAALKSHDADGTLYINTIGVKMDPVSGSGLNPTDLASAVNDWIGAAYRAILSSSLTFDSIEVDSFPTPGTQGVHAVALGGTGPAGGSLPKELCAIFSWKTDNATRHGRGHIAFPLPGDTGLLSSGNNVNYGGTWGTNVNSFFSALDAGHDWVSGGVTEGHISHVVLSKATGNYYDVKTRLRRNAVRWLERRQTAP
jgi:hypothetical protein